MQQIMDNAVEQKRHPLLRLAFRPFFLLGSAFACLAMLLWVLNLAGILAFSPYQDPLFWHMHEMIFGFACAIVAGFLLTAVQNWTSMPGLRGGPLALLVGVWLLARISAAVDVLPSYLHIGLDMLFLPLAAYFLARPIIAVRQYRNLVFIPILALLTVANGMFHASAVLESASLRQQGSDLAVLLIVLVMTVLGGRVIPFFTSMGAKIDKPKPLMALEAVSIASIVVLLIVFSTGLQSLLGDTVVAVLCLVAGAAHTLRWLRWGFVHCLKIPLLWSLQLAYLFIPLGLFALAYSLLATKVSHSVAMHFFTAGAMGNLILGMMARVSLGHTGRTLTPPKPMTLAFACVLVAALLRTVGPMLAPQHYLLWVYVSGALWALGFAFFVAFYAKPLLSPRIDGRPG